MVWVFIYFKHFSPQLCYDWVFTIPFLHIQKVQLKLFPHYSLVHLIVRSFYENTAHDHSLRTFEILDFCEKDKMKTVSQAQDAFLFDILDSL